MFARRMVRRGVRRGIRRGFRRLTRGAILSMAAVAGGVTLATIASREGISREEAEESMDELVSEGVVRKEIKNGETVYIATGTQEKGRAEPQPKTEPAAPSGSVKFCRNCGSKIPLESKFCEKCGARLET